MQCSKFFELLVCALISTQISFAQKIVVDGAPSKGKLKWSDFTGKPQRSSQFGAMTTYKYNTNWKKLKMNGDSITIEGFEVIVELDPKESWSKPDKQTDALLLHEQGHFNIGILAGREIIARFEVAKFTRSNMQSQMQSIMNDISAKYRNMGIQYDKETDHSKDFAAQAKWNAFFAEQKVPF